MRLVQPSTLGGFYALSEIALAITRRSKSRDNSRDRHSLAILWIVICAAILGGVLAAKLFPAGTLPYQPQFYFAGLFLFVAGIMLRWYSILHLGRFFTVDVSIATQHKLIDSGPYHFVRHPSYTGALLVFIGFAFCLGNWLSLLIIIVPVSGAFLWRIHLEEKALGDALGDQYRDYIRRVKRLIPRIY